jgi:cysteine desulfurase/selenocysteine lyase
MALNPEKLREDFPILAKKDAPVYLDSACMSLRPRQVIEALTRYYEEFPACGGRSAHTLSRKVDEEVHAARKTVKKFIGAKDEKDVVFLRNTTEGINLVARSFPFKKRDVILVGEKEHNSNLLPWQLAARRHHVKLDVIPFDDDNAFSLESFKKKLAEHEGKVSMVALGLSSNLDGVSVPGKEVVKLAHQAGAKVLFDAAQAAPHHPLDIRALGADYVAFSGHKMLGPSGIGVLTGTAESLELLEQDNVGGETVIDATFQDATWEPLPNKFEAGLQHYAGIVGLGEACRYLDRVGLDNVHKHEVVLNKSITEGLSGIKGVSFIGPNDPSLRGGVTSFTIAGLQTHDVAMMLDASRRVMVRSGALCVHAWFNRKGLPGVVRSSAYLYNTSGDAQALVDGVGEIARLAR